MRLAALMLVLACAPAVRPVQVVVTFEGRRVRTVDRAQLGADLAQRTEDAAAGVRAWLATNGLNEGTPLPAINGLAVEVPDELLELLRTYPGVLRVELDAVVANTPVEVSVGYPVDPAWNLDLIQARAAWRQGVRGGGVVVASIDTGVDGSHVDLAGKFRGRVGDWFDPVGGTTTPLDFIGHGTQTMGVMVGGDASGVPVGVAPDARWIAARVYDERGQSRVSVIHRALHWALDPDGDPTTDDAPDIVLAAWGSSEVGHCDLSFDEDLDLLRQAGILVVFAAGNSGPAPRSSVSPANLPGVLSVGALDAQRVIASTSSRGPSACTSDVFPVVVAPGVDILTPDVSLPGAPQWLGVSGTSIAAAHVAGVAALLKSAHPRATPADLERALRVSAASGLIQTRPALASLIEGSLP